MGGAGATRKRVNVPTASVLCTLVMHGHGPTVPAMRGALRRQERADLDEDLERLYREAAPKLWRAIYGFTGGRRHLAEDAVAEAFARAFEHAREIRAPLPWIYRTAFRIATRELQREKRRPPAAPDAVPGVDPSDVHDLLQALRSLTTNQRAAVLLHDLEGFTAPEIAGLLGVAAPTVRVHLFRGRRRLRDLLGTEEDLHD
jgi:RNA polymerase sigma factor (sigma-70 family)